MAINMAFSKTKKGEQADNKKKTKTKENKTKQKTKKERKRKEQEGMNLSNPNLPDLRDFFPVISLT